MAGVTEGLRRLDHAAVNSRWVRQLTRSIIEHPLAYLGALALAAGVFVGLSMVLPATTDVVAALAIVLLAPAVVMVIVAAAVDAQERGVNREVFALVMILFPVYGLIWWALIRGRPGRVQPVRAGGGVAMTDDSQAAPAIDGSEIMRQFVPASPFVGFLGIELVELADGEARLRLPFRDELITIGRTVHGGAVASLIDTSAMAAAWTGAEVPENLRGSTVGLTVAVMSLFALPLLSLKTLLSRPTFVSRIAGESANDPTCTRAASGFPTVWVWAWRGATALTCAISRIVVHRSQDTASPSQLHPQPDFSDRVIEFIRVQGGRQRLADKWFERGTYSLNILAEVERTGPAGTTAQRRSLPYP